MDIMSLYNVSSPAIKQAEEMSPLGQRAAASERTEAFGAVLNSAMENLNTTNSYLSGAENEKLRWALGETENTHDLTIALQKASTALQYTVAVRDKFLEAYKEIMNIQI